MRFAYFGLPLGALWLARHGAVPQLAVLSPVPARGERRLHALLGSERVVRARPAEPESERVEAAWTEPSDLVVSWFWTRLLPERWLGRARLGGIGVHPSLLPRHRGPNPFFWAIDAGDELTGVSVHQLAAEYDTGAVALRWPVRVGNRDSWQLARALDRPGLAALAGVVSAVADGASLRFEAADEREATAAPEPEGDLLRVDWSWPSERVLRRIRALAPAPGLAVDLEGVPGFITRATPATDYVRNLLPGEACVLGDVVAIRTGDGAIAIARFVHDDGSESSGAELAARFAERSLVRPLTG